MKRLYAKFPDIYRFRSEQPSFLLYGASIATSLLGIGLLCYYKWDAYAIKYVNVYLLISLQFVVSIYCAYKVSASFTEDRLDGNWDLQRLTPLSAFEVAIGRMLGVSAMALCVYITALFWLFCICVFSGIPVTLLIVSSLLVLVFVLTLSLFLASWSDEIGPTMPKVMAPLVAVFIVLFGVSNPRHWLGVTSNDSMSFYGIAVVDSAVYFCITLLFWGVWAFLGSLWKIKTDLLEKTRPGLFPAFLIFLFIYILGWREVKSGFDKTPDGFQFTEAWNWYVAFIAVSVALYAAVFAGREKVAVTYRWLHALWKGSLTEVPPVWVSGWVTFVFIAIASLTCCKVIMSGFVVDHSGFVRMMAFFPFYALRDLLFLQWMKSRDYKWPERASMFYIGAMYLIPAIGGSIDNMRLLHALFLPVSASGIPVWVSFAGATVNAGAMLAIYALAMRKELSRQSVGY